MRQQGINGLRSVHAGSCHAWPLPADATCATVARQVFRDVVSEVGLEADLLDDCILMASELAANTLHARAVAGTGGAGVVSLTSPEGDRERWSYADLVEVAEQAVRRHEELEPGLDLAVAEA